MSQVLDNLYLGGWAEAKNHVDLKSKSITHIVTVGAELEVLYPGTFKYFYIPALDRPSFDLYAHFEKVVGFIHKAIDEEKGKVFVHCFYGISRSASCVLAYLIKHHNMTPEKANRFLKLKRSLIYPNEGFKKQLVKYAAELIAEKEALKVQEDIKRLYVSEEEIKVEELDNGNEDKGSGEVSEGSEEKKAEEVVKKKEYFYRYSCVACNGSIFDQEEVVHNKEMSGSCFNLYVRYSGWIGKIKNKSGKIYCPNGECKAVVGFAKRDGGNCSCGEFIEKIFAIYTKNVVKIEEEIVEEPVKE